MALTVKYKGINVDNTTQYKTTTIVYQGTKDECMAAADSTYVVNMSDATYGNIEQVKVYQDDGPFWNVEVKYSVDKTNGVSVTGSSYGPKQTQVTVRMMELPLEQHSEYLKKWNYNLYSNNKRASKPDWYDKFTLSSFIPEKDLWDGTEAGLSSTFYEWGKSMAELPSLLNSKPWYEIKKMTKPGYEVYQRPIYELTEKNKHSDKERAMWAVKDKIGKIAEPENGDLGINKKIGGNWLCEGGSVSFDGKYWISESTFLHSAKKKGWDTDLYNKED